MSHVSVPKPQRKPVKLSGIGETQTILRESETQTHVWTPGYVVKSGNPEVLSLDSLIYGRNLPAGRHEADLIDRMRKRKAWENYLAAIHSEKNQEFRSKIISDIELNENMFREHEFDAENCLRMNLVHENIRNFQDYMDRRNEIRVKKLQDKNEMMRDKMYKKLYCQKSRIFRKIYKRQLGINMKYHKTTIFEEACDQTSDLYVNIVRFGSNPRYRHEKLVPEATQPILEVPVSKNAIRKAKTKIIVKKHDCHQKLMVVGEEEFMAMKPTDHALRTPGKAPIAGITTFRSRPENEPAPAADRPFFEKVYQAAVLFQRLIRGRAIQALMQMGLERNRDLIDELKGTFGFSPSDEEDVNQQRYLKMSAFRDYHWLLRKFGLVAIVSQKLTGATINAIADFANKELIRIQDERRAYKIVDVAERARWRREAAEGGRRQKEIRRRRQHDEMYRQVMRCNEITTDFYLKLLSESAIRTVSKEQAHEKAVEYADKIDEEDQKQAKEDKTQVEREEIAAQIIHSFLLPESEKEIVRKRIAQHQEKARDFARRIIYGEISTKRFEHKKESTLLEDLSGNIELIEEEEIVESGIPPEALSKSQECRSSSSEFEFASEEEELQPIPAEIRSNIKEKTNYDQLSINSVESLLQQMAQEAPKPPSVEDTADDDSESIESAPPDCSLFPPITLNLPMGESLKDLTQVHPTKGYQKELDEIKGSSTESSDSDISY